MKVFIIFRSWSFHRGLLRLQGTNNIQRQGRSRQLQGHQMLVKVIQKLEFKSIIPQLPSLRFHSMCFLPPLKASKSPDSTRSPLFQWDRESDMVSRPFAPLWKVVKGEFTWDPQTGHIVSCRTTDKAPI